METSQPVSQLVCQSVCLSQESQLVNLNQSISLSRSVQS